ncbi:Uncharacterized protein TCM_032945 [Theobroma cacao]|uniref:Uncharacterized protein n=1 Tax=Theobroma cacao TaxID=3641 RepID=A0A061FB65_THECC|nr:Uncharacterized protein TCM_032945 [Theobroma cacao]
MVLCCCSEIHSRYSEKFLDLEGFSMGKRKHCVLNLWSRLIVGDLILPKSKKAHTKQVRWKNFLAKIDFELEYKLCMANLVVDVLSHKATLVGIKKDKVEQKRLGGLLDPLLVLNKPWDNVNMDFIIGLL